ncbi:conserved oligomeric Golgi complex subunit 7 [Microplitis demolitor]|uniref:conserved oligomeric Golgi complex subunit 7 n=1 Tax=Microplitis demolitor TaxID=69319 RepID=UPI0004CCA279|nr:conserved oligomeric Golgi complex subunit 7 [Microplitis demolitor]
MDIAAFSKDDFNIKDWINKILESLDSQNDKDAYVGSLIMKLQLYVQQVNGNIEDTSQSVLASLPRIFRETQLLQQEAVSLKDKMSVVKDEIAKIEKDTSLSINSLAKIDKIKCDLEKAKQSLHEADNWSVLANEVEDSFETGDIEMISKKIFSMQKSLSMLTNTIDYEEKKLQLEGLKNRLEAIASPQLVQAFTTRNLEQSKVYVTIFTQISRLDQLEKYYKNCTRVNLTSEWQKITTNSEDPFPQHLMLFFDKLLTTFPEQSKTTASLFVSPLSTLSERTSESRFDQSRSIPPPSIPSDSNSPATNSDPSKITLTLEIYTELLSTLSPTFENQISIYLRQYPPAEQLIPLINIKTIFDNFSINFSHLLDNTTSKNSKLPTLPLAKSIYSPLVTFVSKYTTYETAYLNQQLINLKLTPSTSDLSELIHELSLSIPKIYEIINGSIKRCVNLTNCCGYNQLIMSLNNLLINYLINYTNCLSLISQIKSKTENWNLFQQCLTLMQIIGNLQLTINDINRQLITTFNDYNNKLINNNNNFTKYHLLLINNSDKSLKELINTINDDIFNDINNRINQLCLKLYKVTYEVIFTPIYTQLLVIKNLKWSKNDNINVNEVNESLIDLPDYSFIPQEFITLIGQYLMTLPQHLEPFLLTDNPSLNYALKMADDKFNHLEGGSGGFTGILLGIVAKDACQMFFDQILGIRELDAKGCKQLAVDIDYLGNIFEELGLRLTDNLKAVAALLRLGADEYLEGSVGYNPRIVAAVRQMRNIPSG